jgi:hypothetical protein
MSQIMSQWIAVVLGFTFFAMTSFAASDSASLSGENAIKIDSISKERKIADPQIITDKKLQADEGSLSRYSVKFNAAYAGPGIGDLQNKDQPNPDGVINTFQTKMIGSIGARYRIDGISAVSAGTGISAIHPLHGWDRTDVNSPFISYDRSSRYGDLQMRNILSASGVTTPEYVASGEYATSTYEIDTVEDLGTTRFSVGFDSKIDYFFYNRPFDPKAKSDRGAAQDYLSFYPNLKYRVTEKMNLNTSLAIMFYNPRQLTDHYALWNRTLTQRIGLGYSFARDIYLSPYITVYPNNLRTENTTFNLAAAFSVL